MPRRSELVMQKLVDRVIDMFHNKNMTQEDIATKLCSEGFQTSKSAVGRLLKSHAQHLKEIEVYRKEAESIVLATAKSPGTNMAQAALEITTMKLLRELKEIENFSSVDPEDVVNAIAKVSRAQGYLAKVRLDYEKGYKAGLFDAADRIKGEAKRLGISDENAKQLWAFLRDGKNG